MAFVEEQGEESPGQGAELRAGAVLFATGSSSRHKEAEPARDKTLGVMGTGAARLAPCDGP